MIVSFLAPSVRYPSGGVMAIYEFAGGLSRRGHEVHLVHIQDFLGDQIGSTDDVGWFEFEPGLRHHYPARFDDPVVPGAEFVFCFDHRMPDNGALPLMFVQAFKAFPDKVEQFIFSAACPKICIARWLVDIVKHHGATDAQAVYVPYGLRHEKYHTKRPIEARLPQVAMLYHTYFTKGSIYGLEALDRVKQRIPELEALVFGVIDPDPPLASWITYVKDAPQDFIVDEVYNRSSIFLWPSVLEGFGFPAIEAMACGDALVTTPNGGSADFAIHDETALVAKSKDAVSLAENIEALIVDDTKRVAIARRAQAYVQRYDWDVSAAKLEEFLEQYRADPRRYR